MIWIIAWKNIWRNKTRSLVVILAIFLGMTGGIFSAAVMNRAADQRIKDAIDFETSHIRISLAQFQEDNGQEFYITHCPEITEALSQMPWCEAVCSRLKITAMANTANASGPVQIIGVNPDADKKVFSFSQVICDTCGTWFEGMNRNPIVVGDKICSNYKVHLKSKIVFTFQDIKGEIIGSSSKISGIFHVTNNVFNEFRLFALSQDLMSLTMLPPDAGHEIYVRLKPRSDIHQVKSIIEKALPGMLIETWEEIDPSLGMISNLMDVMMLIFMSIILLALGFGIVNTMLMVVLERTRELGMLSAIGMTRKRIFNMIMLETLLLTLTGAVLGIAFTAFLVAYTGSTGIDLSNYSQGLEAAGYSSFIYPSLDPMFFVELAILIVFTGIVASIFPARRATHLNAAEAVRIEG